MWWYIAGVIMFLITLFVHKHTYETEYDGWNHNKGDKLPCPLWGVLLVAFVLLVPILNLIAFIAGIIIYCIALLDDECIMFEIDWDKQPKWVRKIIMFMTKEI